MSYPLEVDVGVHGRGGGGGGKCVLSGRMAKVVEKSVRDAKSASHAYELFLSLSKKAIIDEAAAAVVAAAATTVAETKENVDVNSIDRSTSRVVQRVGLGKPNVHRCTGNDNVAATSPTDRRGIKREEMRAWMAKRLLDKKMQQQ